MEVEAAIRSRRTHKAYGPAPVAAETLLELFELARWAPNHHLSEPWRFRVLGPRTLERLALAGGASEEAKLRRAPTLVVASAALSGETHQDREDVLATACAVYIVLLAASARGLASYWRTPGVLETPAGRAAVGLEDGEEFVALIHLGEPVTAPAAKERQQAGAYATFLP